MAHFKPIQRDTNYLFPPSMNDWLPEHHLARFIIEIVEQLDLKAMETAYGTSGSAAFHPALLLSILLYGYATGVFSSRKLENATYDSVAFRFVAANEHPDHDTLNTFRKRFLGQIEVLMVQVLMIARTMGMLNLGRIALDGSKLKANASKHSALSYGHIKQLEVQLQVEVKKLKALAEAADNEKIPDGMSVPEEIARREDRIKAIGEAKTKIEKRAKERHAEEEAEYNAKVAKREEKSKQDGKPPRGKAPVAPVEGAKDTDQINLTDAESRIMKVSGGGFEQCYNGQLAVDMDSMLIVNTDTVQACNDKQQIQPALERLAELPEALGKLEHLVADTGYCSDANVKACVEQKVIPLIAVSRQPRAPSPRSDGTLYRTAAAERRCNGNGAHAPCTSDEGRTHALCTTQMYGGTGDWHHQIGTGIPSTPRYALLTAGTGKRQRRIEFGGDGVELETDVCIGGIARR